MTQTRISVVVRQEVVSTCCKPMGEALKEKRFTVHTYENRLPAVAFAGTIGQLRINYCPWCRYDLRESVAHRDERRG